MYARWRQLGWVRGGAGGGDRDVVEADMVVPRFSEGGVHRMGANVVEPRAGIMS